MKRQERFAENVARAERAVVNIRGSGRGGWIRVVRWAYKTQRRRLWPETIVIEFQFGKSRRSIARWHQLPVGVVDDVLRWHARRGMRRDR